MPILFCLATIICLMSYGTMIIWGQPKSGDHVFAEKFSFLNLYQIVRLVMLHLCFSNLSDLIVYIMSFSI